jgi:hypothetical protein
MSEQPITITLLSFAAKKSTTYGRFRPLEAVINRDDRFQTVLSCAVLQDWPVRLPKTQMYIQYRLPIAGRLGWEKLYSVAQYPGVRILDLDDDQVEQYGYFEGGDDAVRYALDAVDAVRVSTPWLFNRLKYLHPNVRLAQNELIDASAPPPRRQPADPPVVTIASMQAGDTLWPLLKRLEALQNNGQINIHLRLIGVGGLPSPLSFPRLDTLGHLPYEQYDRLLRDADLAILPLGEERKYLGKSDLKFLETARNGVPVLADARLYSGAIQQYRTGVLYHDLDDFSFHIQNLTRDSALRQRLSHAAWHHVMNNRVLFPDKAKAEADWLCAQYQNRAKLDKARQMRLLGRKAPPVPQKCIVEQDKNMNTPPKPTFPSISGRSYKDIIKDALTTSQAKWYLEIGCRKGGSLAQVPCNFIGVDPEFAMTESRLNKSEMMIFAQQTSDDFFASGFLAKNDIKPDICFVDGLHYCEFALRDVLNAEQNMTKEGIIFVHDVCPFDYPMASRDISRTKKGLPWTGDVWKTMVILKRHRPDLTIRMLDCASSGLAVITGLNPENTFISNGMEAALAEIDPISFEQFGARNYYDEIGLLSADNFRL